MHNDDHGLEPIRIHDRRIRTPIAPPRVSHTTYVGDLIMVLVETDDDYDPYDSDSPDWADAAPAICASLNNGDMYVVRVTVLERHPADDPRDPGSWLVMEDAGGFLIHESPTCDRVVLDLAYRSGLLRHPEAGLSWVAYDAEHAAYDVEVGGPF